MLHLNEEVYLADLKSEILLEGEKDKIGLVTQVIHCTSKLFTEISPHRFLLDKLSSCEMSRFTV